MATDGRITLHKDNLLSCIGDIKRRLNTGNTAADDECGFCDGTLIG